MSSGDDTTSISQDKVRYLGHKVVVCVPYGRKESFSIMKEYLLKNRHVITEVRLWMNTIDQKDIRYAYSLNDAYPDFFKIVEGGSKLRSMDHASRCRRLKDFYFNCADHDTIYIKMDDDIVYICPDGIEYLLNTRIIHTSTAFMVFGNIINNGICNHIHQRFGALDSEPFTVWHAGAGQGWWWSNWEGGLTCHRSFLNNYHDSLEEAVRKYQFEDYTLHAEHMSINCISWFGWQFDDLNDEEWNWIQSNDENALSEWIPAKYGMKNVIAGKALMSHYAYFPQLEGLNRHKNTLHQYARMANAKDAPALSDYVRYCQPLPAHIKEKIQLIRHAPIEKLKDAEYLEHELIPQLGLYGGDFIYAPESLRQYCGGLEIWQSPKQLSKYLVYLSDKGIKKYAEVGVARGGNFILLSEYLFRFGLERSVAVDIYMPEVLMQYFYYSQDVALELIGSSQSNYIKKALQYFLTNNTPSLILIDDEHQFPQCYANWRDIGSLATYCAFHDINDPLCPGVMKAWREIKVGRKYVEFFDEYPGIKVKMGIGVIENV